jgi:hypothetical protein
MTLSQKDVNFLCHRVSFVILGNYATTGQIISFDRLISNDVKFHLCYTYYCSELTLPFCALKSARLTQKTAAFRMILPFSFMQSADSIIHCNRTVSHIVFKHQVFIAT